MSRPASGGNKFGERNLGNVDCAYFSGVGQNPECLYWPCKLIGCGPFVGLYSLTLAVAFGMTFGEKRTKKIKKMKIRQSIVWQTKKIKYLDIVRLDFI